ncbi:hypothetical protein A3H26_01320 [candidate division WWE3 bacterium RIFCSPLOWO2_12_FULL_36_10]|uniref:Uncharacterized protein n=1 Tax=candidate division WWE3 bacterium RIFCSPLOWO2_12_FULL_36_10 TaxID=1802630 RepID=A0A1F4VJQ5_UNCKA|nr:MAG: hypothetical protein A3H26_01320 [candidate division WWE3 bacterium RIFCSPLOWO2_12_FULL_36_10]
MSRICPTCNTILGSYDNYFCSNCGSTLPQEIAVSSPNLRARVYAPSYLTGKNKFSFDFIHFPSFKKSIAFVFVVCAFLAVSFGFIKFYPALMKIVSSKDHLKKPSLDSDLGKQKALDLDIQLKSSTFGSDKIAEYIPENVVLYLETDDLKKLIEIYAGGSGLNKELINNVAPLLGDHFAFFVTKDKGEFDWNFIFAPRDAQESNKRLKDINERYWNFGIVEGKLVMTSNKKVIEDVRLAKNKISLNMSLNSSYVKEKQKLLPKGQVLIILFSNDGVNALEKIKGFKVNAGLINTIDRILKTGLKSLVIDAK